MEEVFEKYFGWPSTYLLSTLSIMIILYHCPSSLQWVHNRWHSFYTNLLWWLQSIAFRPNSRIHSVRGRQDINSKIETIKPNYSKLV